MKKTIIIVIAILLIIGGLFWYYEIKPAIVRNKCNWEVREEINELMPRSSSLEEDRFLLNLYEVKFKICLRNKGIEYK